MWMLCRQGNIVWLRGIDGRAVAPDVLQTLRDVLTYTHKRYNAPAIQRETGRRMELTQKALFSRDAGGWIYFLRGLLPRVEKALQAAGIAFITEQPATAEPTPPAYQARPRHATDLITFRADLQRQAFEAGVRADHGIVIAPTGFGKSVWIEAMTLAFPHAVFDIVVDRLALVESLVERLGARMPVGQVGGGVQRQDCRVTVYSADSLHKSPASADFLIGDEAHELISTATATQLMRYRHSRNFGLTASPVGRMDGADVRLTAIFGEPIFFCTYADCTAAGLVVPIEVRWLSCSGRNPCEGIKSDVFRKKAGIWRHAARNRVIADAVRAYDAEQVLILVDTVEHAIYLRQYLPEYELVYAEREDEDLDRYKRQGLLPADWPAMSKQRRRDLKTRYEKGELRKVIATNVWSVGVDFTHLQVLVRAAAGAGKIQSIQLPGRVSRINQAIDKQSGLLIDLLDEFDTGFARQAQLRRRHYQEMGWQQKFPDRTTHSLSR